MRYWTKALSIANVQFTVPLWAGLLTPSPLSVRVLVALRAAFKDADTAPDEALLDTKAAVADETLLRSRSSKLIEPVSCS